MDPPCVAVERARSRHLTASDRREVGLVNGRLNFPGNGRDKFPALFRFSRVRSRWPRQAGSSAGAPGGVAAA